MKLAWIFPGQGAQVVGMGKDLVDVSKAARAAYQQADAALLGLDEDTTQGASLSALCFEGPMETLTLTANAQPAIVATSLALLAACRERWPQLPEPACSAGHSLGEYAALCAAGAMSLADGVRTTRVRGRAMQQAVAVGEGAMAAVMALDGPAVAEVCARAASALRDAGEHPDPIVSCANFNGPGQTVIAGHGVAVARATAMAKEAGAKVIPLKVSAPFHCRLMAPARVPLAEQLNDVALHPPRWPVLANTDAAAKATPEAIRQALLEQVDSPVQWVATVEAMLALGVTHALEFGPKKVLASLIKRIDRRLQVLPVTDWQAIEGVGSWLEGG